MTRPAISAPLSRAFGAILFVTVVVFGVEAQAAEARATDLTATFATAGLDIDRLAVFEIAGIVIIRGETYDRAQAMAMGELAAQRGYTRVANLIRVRDWAAIDAEITRTAQRELTSHRSLDGARLRIHAQNGVLRIAGTVRYELQKDTAIALGRTIDGVRSVETELVVAD